MQPKIQELNILLNSLLLVIKHKLVVSIGLMRFLTLKGITKTEAVIVSQKGSNGE